MTLTATVSAGCATWCEGETDAEALVDQADKALYRAKELGRNRALHFQDMP